MKLNINAPGHALYAQIDPAYTIRRQPQPDEGHVVFSVVDRSGCAHGVFDGAQAEEKAAALARDLNSESGQ